RRPGGPATISDAYGSGPEAPLRILLPAARGVGAPTKAPSGSMLRVRGAASIGEFPHLCRAAHTRARWPDWPDLGALFRYDPGAPRTWKRSGSRRERRGTRE